MSNSSILPAEWHPQQCIQLTWPHRNTDFAEVYDAAIQCFCKLAHEIAARQNLIIVCEDSAEVRSQIGNAHSAAISYYEIPLDDVWARDHGGITVFRNNTPYILDFSFNGWGHKFDARNDTRITKQLSEQGAFPGYEYVDMSHFTLEGGAIESNGNGVLLTTKQCLLEDNRNPHLSFREIEQTLYDVFGLQQVLWLNHGYLAGDDTDSHIDTLARFVNEETIVYVKCDDEADQHYFELFLLEQELQAFRQLNGKPYTLIPLPMADPVFYKNERLPATYANFLIGNTAVFVPTYASSKDAQVQELFSRIFPDKEIVGIDCLALIIQHGSLHCVTMQYPKII